MLNRILLFNFLLFTCSNLWAGCTPDTINFYLEKGFTQEQITKLCAQATETKPTYEPYQKPVVIYQEGVAEGNSVEVRRAVNELKGSIDGRSVEVTDSHVNFIRKVCIRAGNSPEVDQRVDKCVDTAFSIARDGLRVTDSGASFLLFGQQNIAVTSSSINRKFVTADPWSGVTPDIRYLLERKYNSQESGNGTDIPLRKSATPSLVVSAIRTISSATEQKKTGSSDSEVAKVLDENYVPPTQEEYLKAQPTLEEIEKEDKKNKKWWNPFD
tara:strand:- start:892 stop:1701 length:810 start_codon:yes stop_codon:yes gene_type:complete